MAGRVAEVEVVAGNALTAAKEALAQLKLQPPRGETGNTGLMGPSGKDAVCRCRNGADSTVQGPTGRDGLQGPRGADGADGHDSPQRIELDNFLIEAKRELKAIRAEWEEQKDLIAALKNWACNTPTHRSEFFAFCQKQAAERKKAHQQ
jgi:hypothetical protein